MGGCLDVSSGDRTVESSRVAWLLCCMDRIGLDFGMRLFWVSKTRVSVLTSIRQVSIISCFHLGLFGRFRSPLGLVIGIELG